MAHGTVEALIAEVLGNILSLLPLLSVCCHHGYSCHYCSYYWCYPHSHYYCHCCSYVYACSCGYLYILIAIHSGYSDSYHARQQVSYHDNDDRDCDYDCYGYHEYFGYGDEDEGDDGDSSGYQYQRFCFLYAGADDVVPLCWPVLLMIPSCWWCYC